SGRRNAGHGRLAIRKNVRKRVPSPLAAEESPLDEPHFARGIIGSKLPAIFPLSSVFSSTVIASGTPPFGVQLPDQVPLIAVRSAGATGASSSNNNVMNTKSIVFIATSGEFQIPVSRAAPGGSRQTIES
ncbi:MAG: hypothetical protein DMG16_07850, partial [Acidobacteria bacterium]